MSEIPKAYEPQSVESKWYQFWLDQGFFTANPASPKPPYSIVIPPPNVTGILHLGHVLNNTIQDILSRKARMEGKEVLWLPGTDHAGIATQVVVEKRLKKEEKKSRHDLGREEFVKRVWEFKEAHGGIIIQQLKKLGCSCDWTRERFTLDPDYSRKVAQTFVDLYQKGLIYKGRRMVNWCPVSMTALSDEEVEMKEQNGLLYYFKVEVVEEPGTFLSIATTRPETIPGDTGVAVNPKDQRYARLIGKHVRRPLPAGLSDARKQIPIVGDELVDFEFGTGVLKVTPAHDKVDFEIGQRHGLEALDVIAPNGVMNELAGPELKGLDRFAARKAAAAQLEQLGCLEKAEPYKNNVGFSERTHVPIEPRLSEQWFLKYPKVKEALDLAANGELQFFPDRWGKVYKHWLENIQDWCISRQLWWGHQIPVWYRGDEMLCQVESPGEGWTQDQDVLDTWCSSWLWPFATMDEATRAKFYPTTVLVTAPEILFFWVARMIMAGLEYTGKTPFKDVYLTGIVRDKSREKMSKSLGNSPDPLDLIAQYGADALRFGIMRSAPLGQDVIYDEQHVVLGRNFCNKLWNACRFRQMQGGQVQGELNPIYLTTDDKWILLKLGQAIKELTGAMASYKFTEATQVLYRFFWSEYCDWYVEASKAALQGADKNRKTNTIAVMDFVLSHTLRLFHPFIPFVTEELWNGMGYTEDMPSDQGGATIMFAPWPKPFDQEFRDFYSLDDCYLAFAEAKYELVTQGRNLRRLYNIPGNQKIRFIFKPLEEPPPHDIAVLKILLNAERLDCDVNYQPERGTPAVHTAMGELYLPLEGLIDPEAERARLARELSNTKDEILKVEKKLGNPDFVAKVPASVLEEHRERLTTWQTRLDQIQKAVDNLS